MKWSPEFLKKNFGSVKTRCRFHRKDDVNFPPTIAWESECQYDDCTIGEFVDWIESSCNVQNGLGSERESRQGSSYRKAQNNFKSLETEKNNHLIRKYSRDLYWGYIDYKYFGDLFSNDVVDIDSDSPNDCANDYSSPLGKRFKESNSSDSSSTSLLDSVSLGHIPESVTDSIQEPRERSVIGVDTEKDLSSIWKASINWNVFNLNKNVEESVFWFGSDSSYTPCHQDTYGYNLVAQVHGCKKWTLFSPQTDTDAIKPTRIPYEESSVYSELLTSRLLSEKRTSLQTQRNSKGCIDHENENDTITKDNTSMVHGSRSYEGDGDDKNDDGGIAYQVELNKGDVLYVPKHWWHFVQTTSPNSISMNLWCEERDDCYDGVKEALVKTIANALITFDDKKVHQQQHDSDTITGISCPVDKVKEKNNHDDNNNNNNNSNSNANNKKGGKHPWFNPNEEIETKTTCMSYLNRALSLYHDTLGGRRSEIVEAELTYEDLFSTLVSDATLNVIAKQLLEKK